MSDYKACCACRNLAKGCVIRCIRRGEDCFGWESFASPALGEIAERKADDELDKEFVDSVSGAGLPAPSVENGPFCVDCIRYGSKCNFARPGESSAAHLCIYYVKRPQDNHIGDFAKAKDTGEYYAPLLKPVINKMVRMNECLEKVLRLLAEKSSVEASAKLADKCVTDALRQEIKDLEADIDDYGEKIRMAKHQHDQLSALLKATK